MALKVLIIRLSAIGDVVHTLPLASAIKDLLPGAHITWVVDKAASDLVLNNPVIDKTIVFPGKAMVSKLLAFRFGFAEYAEFFGFLKELRGQKYDVAIDAQGLFKSAILTYMSGAKIRIGFAGTRECADRLLTHPMNVGDYFGNERSIVELNLSLAKKLQEVVRPGWIEELKVPSFVLPALPAVAILKADQWMDRLSHSMQIEQIPSEKGRRSEAAGMPVLPAEASKAGPAPGAPLVSGAEAAPGAPLVPGAEAAPGAPSSQENSAKINEAERFADGSVGSAARRPVVVVVPGTTWDSKLWPVAQWCNLTGRMMNELGLNLILVGGAQDIQTNREIAEYLRKCGRGNSLNLTGQTSLLELCALFQKTDLVVGADTGPLHLAAATGVPKVAGVFGSTPWLRNGPYGKQCQSIYKGLSCQPCFQKVCPLSTKACLIDMDADYVFEELVDFWSEQ